MRTPEVYANIRSVLQILKYKDLLPTDELLGDLKTFLKTKRITPYQIAIGDDFLLRELQIEGKLDIQEAQAIKYLSYINSDSLKNAMLYKDLSNLDAVILNYSIILDIYEKIWFKTIE